MRIARLLLLAVALAGCSAAPAAHAAPPIKHVFVIVLENESASTSFGPNAPSPYLARTLPSMGAFVPNYYAIGHASLDNYIAMVSGQRPNLLTQADCPLYIDVFPGLVGADGQTTGLGCVYPKQVQTVADQLTAKGLSWRGYMQSMGADPSRESATCGHPAIGSQDKTESATAKDQYATRHDPFVYFHSIIDDQASCDAHVVNLSALPGDIASSSTTRSYSFITPDLCADGHDATCADSSRPGGFAGIDDFLSTWVPRIVASPGFRDGGLLVVTFDEAETSDDSSCCAGPSSGGGRTGAVLVSPYIKPGTVTQTPYNHYSLLRSVEDMFGLGHLGYAAAAGLQDLGDDVFTAPNGDGLSAAAPACQGSGVVASVKSHRLRVRSAKALKVTVRVRPRSGRSRRRTLHVHACRTATMRLPRGHGRLSVRGGGKTQRLHY